MDTEKKLLGLLKDAAVIVHKYYYETNMPIKDVCTIIQILSDNYANNIDELPVDEYTLNAEEDPGVIDTVEVPAKKEKETSAKKKEEKAVKEG